MSKNKIPLNINTSISLFLDIICHYYLLVAYVNYAKLGNSRCNAFLSYTTIRDASIFVFEANKFMSRYGYRFDDQSVLWKNIEKIRHHVHLFISKEKTFESESRRINASILDLKRAFLTEPKDDIYNLRNDLELIQLLNGSKKILMGSTLFPWDILRDTDMIKNGKIIGDRIQQYSKELASTLNSLRFPVEELIGGILSSMPTPLTIKSPNKDIIHHEDVKIDYVLEKSPYSFEITYCLMIILHEIGSLKFLLENFLESSIWLESNDIWMYFISKQIAIRLYEIYDAINIIEKIYPEKDSIPLIKELSEAGLFPMDHDLYDFSHNLRNALHYNHNKWAIDLSNSFYLNQCFIRQAGVNNKKTDFRDFYTKKYHEMTNLLFNLHRWIISKVDLEGEPAD
ncbi:MAG: hypothetical protein Q8O09_02005 [Bacillota bacterium]|nr:hypothetical protein [Bacillota bacterium]